jgi:hypothetical protein
MEGPCKGPSRNLAQGDRGAMCHCNGLFKRLVVA